MRKRLSTIGILFLLALKNPPIPEFNILHKISIVAVHGFSTREIAGQFHLN